MAKLSTEIIEDLYSCGKAVYMKEIGIQKAVETVLQKYPDKISDTSARFYIDLYASLVSGKGSTWNQNTELVLYYVEHITLEEGIELGNKAMAAALKFAYAKSREQLITSLQSLGNKLGLSTELRIEKGGNDWQPLLVDYNPGITEQKWVEIFNIPTAVSPEWRAILAAFHAEGDAATCQQLAEKYGRDAPSISGLCTAMARRMAELTGSPIFESDGKKQYWYILFQSKSAGKNQPGENIWKLRPELSAAIDETDIMDYLWKVGEPPKVLTPKEALERIKRYIAGSGFTYDSNLIENFYLSLKSKPFVILAGTSGTGKTRLVRLFAEAIGATSANGRYCQVAVRPDWSDSTDLFGHIDLNGNFVPGAILPFLKAATDDPKHPYILCLDEMNLARVEYYMSDFLSIIESRDLKDGEITSDLIMTLDKYGGKEGAEKKYGEIRFPQNLYIVGTVNMDETTFPFSRKVLDRANTIEFNYVDLGLQFSENLDAVEPYEADNSFLMSEYLVLGRDCQKYFDVIGPICAQLESINKILRKANAHVGYRVRDEIVFYLINNMNADLLTREEAFDNSIMQKILPRIQGSSASIKTMLCELFESLSGQMLDANAADTTTAAAMQKIIDGGTVKYPKSAAKIKFMVQRFEEDGFTSYWL